MAGLIIMEPLGERKMNNFQKLAAELATWMCRDEFTLVYRFCRFLKYWKASGFIRPMGRASLRKNRFKFKLLYQRIFMSNRYQDILLSAT